MASIIDADSHYANTRTYSLLIKNSSIGKFIAVK